MKTQGVTNVKTKNVKPPKAPAPAKPKKEAKSLPKPNLKKGTVTNVDGFPVVGWLVNWSAKDYSIKRDDLIVALRKCGIDPEIAVEVLAKNAALRATKEKAKGKDSFHRKVADQEDKAAFVIVDTDVDENKLAADFTTRTNVIYDKDKKDIQVDGPEAKDIKQLFEQKKIIYDSQQFRNIILRYVKRYCQCITYLETGNLYFVPAAHKADLDKLINLFQYLGPNVRLTMKEEIDTKQVRQVLWQVTIGELKGDLEGMTKDLEKLGDEITERSFESRLKKYDDLKARVEMYEVAMEVSATDLKTKLSKLTETLKAKTVGV